MKPFEHFYTEDKVPTLLESRRMVLLHEHLTQADPRHWVFMPGRFDIDLGCVIEAMVMHPDWNGRIAAGPWVVAVVNSEAAAPEVSISWTDGHKTFSISQAPINGFKTQKVKPGFTRYSDIKPDGE